MEDPECIIFDLAGVIFEEGHLVKKILHPLLRNFNEPISYEQLRPIYEQWSKGEISEREFWKAINVFDYQKIRKNLIETVKGNYDEKFEYIKMNLNHRKIVVVSDLPESIVNAIIPETYFKFDHVIATGAKYKTRKDNAEVYKKVLEDISMPANDCIFIDDKIRNLKFARMNGIKTVLLVREMKMLNDDIDYIDIIIPKLESLADILTIRSKDKD